MRIDLIAALDVGKRLRDLAFELLGREGIVPMALKDAPARALARVGGEKHLDLRIGEDDGARCV